MVISFRDPSGFVINSQGRIIRVISETGKDDFQTSLVSPAVKGFVNSGKLVSAHPLDPAELKQLLTHLRLESLPADFPVALVVEHERIPFQSFPYEWPPEMLHASASLTLDLAEGALVENLGLKDATPYNILFRGAMPVFVDWLSFERRDPLDPVWLPYAQFIRTFILPLLVNLNFGLRLDQLLIANRDGLEPEAVYQMCGAIRKFSPSFLSLVSLPTLLGAKHNPASTGIYQRRNSASPEKAQFILLQQFRRFRRLLRKVALPKSRASTWSNYMGPEQHFTNNYLLKKQSFVEDALKEFSPGRVLDVGCNNGHFSRIAAAQDASVVAIDQDPVVVGQVWHTAAAEGLNILPLVVDLTRPSPGVGWRNIENPSFIERAKGSFDAVLMLAVIHHMMVSERIPLNEILALVAEITTDILIIEFIGTDDPMFLQLTRGRKDLFSYLTREYFEQACGRYFTILRFEELEESKRWIYLLQRKQAR